MKQMRIETWPLQLIKLLDIYLTFINFVHGEIEHYCKERKDDSTDHGGRHFDGREKRLTQGAMRAKNRCLKLT